ncbi:MAG: LysR family transcriptional regulator [Hyphomicrobiaceae bacterium]|nr:LysR family transcriptional regulator [Hyphomicrobiaceae bacterium]
MADVVGEMAERQIDWDNVRIFLAVARAGQLLGAARRLGLDQATVTRRMDRLEEGLGVRLVERTTSGSQLTSEGEAFLAHAERMEIAYKDLEAALSTATDAVSGTVRIGAPDAFGTLFLATRLARLMDAHDSLTIELVPLPRTFSLSKREVDLAITVERPEAGRLKSRKLSDYSLSLYASRDYLADAPALEGLADLARHRIVGYVPDLLFAPSLDLSREVAEVARTRFQCASALGQIAAVQGGMGVGLLHDYAVAGKAGLVRVVPEFVVRRAYHLVQHSGFAETAAARAVREFIIAEATAAKASFLRA